MWMSEEKDNAQHKAARYPQAPRVLVSFCHSILWDWVSPGVQGMVGSGVPQLPPVLSLREYTIQLWRRSMNTAPSGVPS